MGCEAAQRHLRDCPKEVDTYKKVLADVSKKLEPEAVPAMPVISWKMMIAAGTKAKSSNKTSSKTEADLRTPMDEESAYRNNEGFLLVHTPVGMKEAMQKPKAKEAMEREWLKLEKGTKSGPAWDLTKPRSKEDVKRKAQKAGKKLHFGDLIDLCFEKNSQLSEDKRKYKGRVVFRGDQVKDEQGIYESFLTRARVHLTWRALNSPMPSQECQDAVARTQTQTALTRRLFWKTWKTQ